MRTKSFITRASLLILSLVLFIPESFSADMESYCVLPPYVKKGAIPNIMFLMDKSDDMLNPAYTDSYTPNTTIDNYKGYFKPQACYSYGSQKFTEKLKVVLATDGGDEYGTSYTDSDTCPSSAPFRGNLLNWATMSKFDILEKIIIGGNSVSKQGNAHSLLGIEGTWSKTYSGCVFEVNNGNLTISDVDTSTTCDLIAASPSPIALNKKQTKTLASLNKRSDRNKEMIATVRQSISPKVQTTAKVNEPTLSFSYILKNLFSKVARFFNDIEIIPQAYAAAACDITPGSLNATVGLAYNLTLSASGGSGSSNYSWIMSGVPAWLTGPTFSGTKNNTATWTGTAPVTPGNYTFTATIGGRCSPSYSESFTIVVSPAPLSIQTSSLNDATEGTAYSFTVTGVGGVTPYTWSAANLPPGLSICAGPANCTSGSNTYTPGTIYGTPTANGNYNGIVITVTDSQSPAVTASKTFSMKVSGAAPKPKSTTFNIKVTLTEEPLTDVNGNDIYDGGIGESYQDLNENGEWDGKQGVFQRYWDENNPKANWGLTEFTNQGVTVPSQGCIPASPQSSFLTAIENATGETTFPLSDGLYGIINYFAFDAANFSQYDADSYKGCNSQDPLDRVPCRKNFVLIISSGSDVTGSNFSQDDCVNLPNNNNSAALVENACFGFKNDLRSDKTGKQNILTYVVNALGTTNQDILEDTAYAGNGKYYNGDNPEELEKQLNQAFKDILARAASGTAASVLASGEGQGANLVQAVFYPKTQTLQAGSIFSTEISWIGRLARRNGR
ncbi:MAG: hypothetical protein HY758_03240 [Nitrospirae bacterium]|nr:hypothetical protein [Nitrospirota bacterium]